MASNGWRCFLLTLALLQSAYGVSNKPARSAHDRGDYRDNYESYGSSYGPPKDHFVPSRYHPDSHRQDHGYNYENTDKYYGTSGYGSSGHSDYGSSGHSGHSGHSGYGSAHDKQYYPGEGGFGFSNGHNIGGYDYNCCGGPSGTHNGGHYPSNGGDGGHYPGPPGHGPGPSLDHHLINEHKKAVIKGALLPLAGVALLGVAAALASNPVLLQLGVVSAGKRRKRRSISNVSGSAPYELRSAGDRTNELTPYRAHGKA